MSLLRFLFGSAYFAVLTTAFIGLTVLLLPWRVARVRVCNWYGRVVGRGIVWFAGITPRVRDHARLQATNPAIYVMNHTSTVDAFLCIWLCPIGVCGVFKKEVLRIPFYGQLAWLSGHLLIDRNHRGKAVEALREAAGFVRANRLGVWIMPEGTRARDGRLRPFKRGFVHLAIATGYPVVPVVGHGAHRNWATGSFLSYKPLTLDIEVLPPIDTSGWREETAGEHAEEVRRLFARHLPADMQPVDAA